MRAWVKKHREDFICAGLLLVAAMVSLWPVLFAGQLPYDAGQLEVLLPWASNPDAIPETAPRLGPELRYHIPNYAFIVDSARENRSLRWNPLEYGGMPFIAQWRTRCFSPFTLPFYLFGLVPALRISLLLKVFCAGGTAYYAARRLGISPPFAILAALTFQLGAPISLYTVSPICDTLVWFPLFFVFLERLALKHLAHWATGATVCALMILGGSPETLAGIFTLGAVYLSVRLYLRRGELSAAPSLLTYAATVLFAGLLCAFQLLPYAHFRIHTTALEPLFDRPPLAVIHVGLINVLLAGVWLSMRQHIELAHRHRIDSTVLTALIAIAVAVPAAPLLAFLPLFNLLETHHLLAGVAFVIAVGASAAGEAWLELSPAQCKSVLKRLGIVAPTLLLPALLLSLLPFGLAGSFKAELVFAGAVVLGFALLFGFTLFRPNARVMGYGLALLCAVELLAAFFPLRHFSDSSDLFPETGTIADLQKGVLVAGGPLLAQWPLAANGIPQLYGASPYANRQYHAWLHETRSEAKELAETPAETLYFAGENLGEYLAPVRARLHLTGAYPRAIARFHNPTAPAAHRILSAGERSSSLAPGKENEIEVVEADGGAFVFNVKNVRGNALTFWAAPYPGWQAYVDDVSTEIDDAGAPFQTIPIAQGEHQAVLRYQPVVHKYGLWLSLTALVVLGLGYLNIYRERIALRQYR